MTEVKHTPGPWKIVRHMGFGLEGVKETDDPECQMGFAGPNGERVCWFGQSANYEATEGDEPSEADARLIAAAPDLLEALKAVTSSCTSSAAPMSEGQTRIVTAPSRDSLVKAYAAIALAKGPKT